MSRAGSIRPVTRQERAVLAHPDQRSGWVIVLRATLEHALDGEVLDARIRSLSRRAPIIGARLDGRTWIPGDPPRLVHSDVVGAPFRLDREPPLRVALAGDGRTLVVEGHHAFDGRALVAVVRALTHATAPDGGGLPSTPAPAVDDAGAPAGGPSGSRWSRLVHPADRVAPSRAPGAGDAFVTEEVPVSGGGFTALLASACARAVIEHNRSHGVETARLGISIGLGGSNTIGNTASYRRLDLDPRSDPDVAGAVTRAIRRSDEPAELRFAPRAAQLLMRAVASRFSDTFLLSNLGVLDLPEVRSIAFFPVARGRSAMAFGAASVEPGVAGLTLRARDLDDRDARALLGAVARDVASVRAHAIPAVARPVSSGRRSLRGGRPA